MKKQAFLILLIIVLFIASCNKNVVENKYLHLSLTVGEISQEIWWDKQTQRVVRMKDQLNDFVGEQEVRKAGITYVEGDFDNTAIIEQKVSEDIVKYIFNSDGTLDLVVFGQHQSGTWEKIRYESKFK